jgi:PAS domain S-box-containing protein
MVEERFSKLILLAVEDHGIRGQIRATLEKGGFQIARVNKPKRIIKKLEDSNKTYAAVIAYCENRESVETLTAILNARGMTPVVLLADSYEIAIEALESGVSAHILWDQEGKYLSLVLPILQSAIQANQDVSGYVSDKYKKLFDTSPDGIITVDVKGKTTSCNPAFLELTGYEYDDIVGKFITQLPTLHKHEAKSYVRLFGDLLSGNGPSQVEFRWVHKDGSVRFGKARTALLRKEGRLEGLIAVVRDTTGESLLEEAIRASEVKFRALFEHSLDGVYLWETDEEGLPAKCIEVNAAACDMLGYDREEILQLSQNESDFRKRLGGIPKISNDLYVQGQSLFESVHVSKDGNKVPVEIHAHLFELDGKKVILSVVRDISARKKVEEKLIQERDLIRDIMATSPVGITIVDADGRITYANSLAENILGLTREAITELSYNAPEWAITDLEGNPFPNEELPFSLVRDRKKAVFNVQHAIEWPSGRRVLLSINASPVFDDQNEFGGMIATIEDITRRVEAQNELEESEEKYRNIIESIPVGMHMYTLEEDGNLVFTGSNTAADRLLGVDNSQFIGMTIEAAFPPLEETDVPNEYRRVAKKGGVWGTDLITYEHGEISGAFEVHAFQTAPRKMVAAFMEVTEQRKAISEMKRLTTIIEATSDVVGIANLDGDLVFLNQAGRDILDIDAGDDITKYHISEFHDKESYRIINEEGFPAVIVEDRWLGEVNLKSKTDQLIPVSQMLIAHKDEQMEEMFISTIMRDVTTLKNAEAKIRSLNEELEQRVVERTEELQQVVKELEAFSYSVSHDLRAPLRAINGYGTILATEYSGELDDKASYYLEQLRTASNKMADLINDMLALSHLGRKEVEREQVDYSALVNQVIRDVLEEVHGRIIDFEVMAGMEVYADRSLIETMVSNLIRNAVKFTAGREQAKIEVQSYEREGDKIFYVKDNGVGFNMDYVDKLFEPFQRLHGGEYEGTGIGLAIVRRVVERHGGKVWIEAKENQGTTVFFTI